MTSIGLKLKIVNSSDCEIITFTPRKTSQANPMGSTDLKGHEIIDSSYKLFFVVLLVTRHHFVEPLVLPISEFG